jgi:hypothetical protein
MSEEARGESIRHVWMRVVAEPWAELRASPLPI